MSTPYVAQSWGISSRPAVGMPDPGPPPVTRKIYYSGDLTGAADGTAFIGALGQLPLSADGIWREGLIEFDRGHFYFAAAMPNIGPHVRVKGPGENVTFLHSMVGAGVSTFSQHGSKITAGDFIETPYGGGWTGLTIDGSLAAQGAIGLDVGDAMELEFGLKVQNFTGNVIIQNAVVTTSSAAVTRADGSAFPASVVAGMKVSGGTSTILIPATSGPTITVSSVSADGKTVTLSSAGVTGGTGAITFAPAAPAATSTGVWARNYNSWSEKWHGYMSLMNNDNGIVVDVTANPIDASTNGTASHEFWDLTFRMYMGVYQNGFVIQNGSSVSSGNWEIGGNYENSNDTSIANYSMFTLTGTVPAGHSFAGTASQAAMRNLSWGITSDLNGSNPPTRYNVAIHCELVAPGYSRYTGRGASDNFAAGAIAIFPSGGLMDAGTPSNSRAGSNLDGFPLNNSGVTTTAGSVTAMQTVGTEVAATGAPNYKQVVIYMSGWTSTTAPTFTWTTGFINKPEIIANTTGLTPTAITTGHIVLPAPTTATGIIMLGGY